MQRDPRFFEPRTLVEVTNVTLQNRYLLRPSEELNDLFIGVVGRAQRMYGMPVCCVVALSSHFHMLLIPNDAEHLADFMEHVNGNLSKEIGRLHGWKGRLWRDRFHMVPVTEEEAAQVGRLRYVLGAGVKENLVDRVADWPGVHSGPAMIEGGELTGHWYDRTKEHAARRLRREKDVDPEQFATEERVFLSPLPCWEHLAPAEYRVRVAELVAEIDEEGARERRRTGKQSLGVKRILRARPTRRPRSVKKSPKPRFHGLTDAVLKRWREAYQEVIQAYRLASERLGEGDLTAAFPEGTFPPALPFMPFLENLVEARGQPV